MDMGEEKAWMTRCPAWKQGLVWRARDRREQSQMKLGPCVATAGGTTAPREGQRVT